MRTGEERSGNGDQGEREKRMGEAEEGRTEKDGSIICTSLCFGGAGIMDFEEGT